MKLMYWPEGEGHKSFTAGKIYLVLEVTHTGNMISVLVCDDNGQWAWAPLSDFVAEEYDPYKECK